MQDTVADLDSATYEQVARLLGSTRAAEMLGLLQETLVRLSGMPQDELVSRAGLASVHRLKSEAGLMGFNRLSRACEVVDTAGARGSIQQGDLQNLREAIATARWIIGARIRTPVQLSP
nr:Hpt domain-containing protein [Methylobacterium sp. L1A1]